ncbi:EAL domain-containing protein [Marinivivus vitaminiproducens]|uniref:bifunctional diguanylate cyclase/phosphodiesterase n=1 Tax=Marinivivus vitaminiproducens TaxID=3035935 RepID=UPI0027A037BD|nr:EAL domain-containing protein [Geminicoccaceae bacterium SCSIO 64248]
MTLVALIVFVAIAFAIWTAAEADRQRYRLAHNLIASQIAQRLDRLERIAADSAWWQSIVVGTPAFADPAAIGDGLASWLNDFHEIDLVRILDADDRPIYSARDGDAEAASLSLSLRASTLALAGKTRSGAAPDTGTGPPVSGFVTGRRGARLGAAAPVPTAVAAAWNGATGAVMILSEPFDEELLAALARAASVDAVRFVPAGRMSAGDNPPWIVLADVAGTPIGELRWDMESALAGQLPLLTFIVAMVGGLAIITVMLAARATREVEHRENALTDFAESASDWLWQTDVSDRITFLSPRFYTDTGLSPEAVLGKRPRDILAMPSGVSVPRGRRRGPKRRAPFREIVRGLRTVYGDLRLVQLNGTPIVGRGGVFEGYRGTATDVTERYRAEQHIRFLAEHDPLTGLLNRKVFEARLDLALAYGRRFGPRSALVVMDLNEFKLVNDTLGHPTGDRLLVAVADRLRALVRETDMVARLGGDEFAILLAEVASNDEAMAFAARVQAAMAEPCVIDEEPLRVASAMGIALCPDGIALDADGWMRRADLALYRAKADPTEPVQVFRHAFDEQRRRQLKRKHDLARALDRGEFQLRYQPQIGLADGRIVGTEALLRWHHADRGWISPQVFIPEAEACGLILPIGRWVLYQACRDARAWLDAGLDFGRVAINLSPVQFGHPDIVAEVEDAMRAAGLDAAHLELEITEGMLMRDAEAAKLVLQKLDATGVTITLDDFGKGYSSLAYLRRFPLRRLKIDQAFVRDVAADPDAAAITRTIVQLGHSLRLTVLGEGVETDAQRRQLRNQGCDCIQGHLIAVPMPAEAYVDFMRAHQAAESEAVAGE